MWCIGFAAVAQTAKTRTGIGLTLSGGGAKGLAHIGFLKAIDSAGLNIDYITGTSMGSIVGGLYAAGYSADSIEKIARQIDWDVLLSNTIPMTSYTMEEKSEYGKYAAELPVQKGGKIGIPSGFLESQELWLTLMKYFFPVANVHDFNKLSIPYRCIGTDLATGEATVFSTGSLVSAIRASMAIPGVFSPVDINKSRYVDGGVVRNFPVKDVINMGATYAIGISVSSPLKDVKELNDAIKVLTQVVFLSENKDRLQESALCNLLINVPMGDFTSASFGNATDIINLGIEEGRKYYPHFKKMADSLKALYPNYHFQQNRLPAVNSYHIAEAKAPGLQPFQKRTFLQQMGIDSAKEITEPLMQKSIRKAYAYRMYKSIVYHVEDSGSNQSNVAFKVRPESAFMLKAGLQQNSFSGFGLHLNLTARNAITPFSRSMLSLNLGQNFRGLFEHLQMFSYNKPWSNRLQVYTEWQDVPNYTDFRRTGLYKFRYFTIDDRFQLSAKRRAAGGIGFQWELIDAQPEIESGVYFKGQNHFFQLYGFWQYNTLNKPQFAAKGTRVELQGGYVFGVRPNFEVYRDGILQGEINNSTIQFGNYLRSRINFLNITPLHKKWAWTTKLQGGANFSGNISLLNNFLAGGMNPTFRNQIEMAGLREGEVVSESMASFQTGPRLKPFGSLYLTLLGSVLTYDFIPKAQQTLSQQWVVGTGISIAYDLPIGPIEFTLMVSSKTEGIRSYFNFGFPFK